MSNSDLSMSDAGLEFLKAEEAVIEGIYDDPSGYCTYGVGHLVHKSRSYLLAAASADSGWKSYVKKKWGKMPYLDRAVRSDKNFDKLKEKAKASAKSQAASKVKLVESEAQVLSYAVDTLLKKRVAEFERGVRNTINVSLTQDEFDALVSFAFNIGSSGFASSTAAKKINEGKYKNGDVKTRKAAIAEIDKWIKAWNKSGGKVLSGLVKRREREADLFLKHARQELKKLEAARSEASSPQSSEKAERPFLMNEVFEPSAIDAPYCPTFPMFENNPRKKIIP